MLQVFNFSLEKSQRTKFSTAQGKINRMCHNQFIATPYRFSIPVNKSLLKLGYLILFISVVDFYGERGVHFASNSHNRTPSSCLLSPLLPARPPPPTKKKKSACVDYVLLNFTCGGGASHYDKEVDNVRKSKSKAKVPVFKYLS